MTDRRDAEGVDAAVTAAGVTATIPAAVLVALLTGAAAGATEPVTVDARDLRASVPAGVVADLLRAVRPGRPVSVRFESGAVVVSTAGLPEVRLVVPDEGLRLRLGRDGLSLGG
jgi:hypothetical protein